MILGFFWFFIANNENLWAHRKVGRDFLCQYSLKKNKIKCGHCIEAGMALWFPRVLVWLCVWEQIWFSMHDIQQNSLWCEPRALKGRGGISDKTCFIILHLVIKPANVPSVGCMFKSNASPSFYSLLLPFSFCLSPNRCSHPRSLQSAWLSGQYSQFSSPRLPPELSSLLAFV